MHQKVLFGGAALYLLHAAAALASPENGVVSAGNATIARDANTTVISQISENAVIDWARFNLAAGESVRYDQPGSTSILLNRIQDRDPSVINGHILANGQVWFTNPNGILFGPDVQVTAAGLLATTSTLSNARFMAADYRFEASGVPDGLVANYGSITVSGGGLAALVAPNVINKGIISARLGTVALASGDAFTLDTYGDGLLNLQVSDAVMSQLVDNGGILAADGGWVLLTAAAAGDVVNSLVNVDGALFARSIGEEEGTIVIYAKGSNAVEGNDAEEKGLTPGESTVLVSGLLDASGYGEGEKGGDISVLADAVGIVNGAVADASGDAGGGNIRIGGDYLGGGTTPTAHSVFVDSFTLLYNDALTRGNGGRSIVWSDGDTRFYGNIYARGGREGGNGGFVETSGKQYLDAKGFVDLTAVNGDKGTYLLDPASITILGNFAPTDITGSELWLDAADTSTITTAWTGYGGLVSGSVGTTTLNSDTNESGFFVPGETIRLNGTDSYTVVSVAGTVITVAEPLTTTYTTASMEGFIVSGWTDKSTDGTHDATTGANVGAYYVSSSVNGHAMPTFLRTALTYYTISGMSLAAEVSAFVALKPSDSGSGAMGIFQNASNLNSSAYSFEIHRQAGEQGVVWRDDLFGYSGAASISDNTPVLLSQIRSGSTGAWAFAQFLNGGANGTDATAFDPGGTTNFTIGRLLNLTDFRYSGGIGEIIIYDTALTATDRQLVEQYQSAKWNIALTPPGTGATEAAQAMAADGYSSFTVSYLERLSQSANISLLATSSILLNLGGDTLNLASDRSLSLTTTSGNIMASGSGSIVTNRTGSGGNITMTAGGSGNIDLTGITLTAGNNGSISLNAGGTVTCPSCAVAETLSSTQTQPQVSEQIKKLITTPSASDEGTPETYGTAGPDEEDEDAVPGLISIDTGLQHALGLPATL